MVAARPDRAAVTNPRKPAGNYHHGNLRTALVACGLRLLENAGPTGLSLRQAAEMAGVSPAAPAHHFGDRAGLLAAIAAEGFRRLNIAARQHLAAGVPGLVRNYVQFAAANAALFHLMFGPEIPEKSAHPELAEVAERSFRGLDFAVAAHLKAAGRAHEPAATMAVWSLMHGLAMLLIERQRAPRSVAAPPPAVVIARATEALLAGLVAQAAPAPPST